ncbi:DUF397 domain-containing protein [Streptomyces albidoflavus]|uniref:DUF397 domain-containing protein n=1 Tax=Streptomyces albidoflavus TaxID=1886 RepID=UPI00101E3759|nr:DUF397 domain-containing protein [Streptomyces albidoflavus]RZD86769.1 DUF397 domain-containing protein [Streptomyces albidoflavus]RZE02197.1 DUF397 domain-containing protein [Streptomyces albidoflavus]RZE03058.1 DUF397 domain-containing protein [Streptomyces albidoflavus]
MTTETPVWFTSSYSNNGGECVEVAINLVASRGIVPVRDSKVPAGPVLTMPATSFACFVSGVRAGDFPV